MKIKSKKPKHFAGAGALIGLGGSILTTVLKNRAAKQQGELADEANLKAMYGNVNSANDLYSDYIANHPELVHGTQKEIQALGSDGLDTITKDMQLVDAGTHESGNDLERRNDYVEGGEVVMGEEGPVYSNRIDAYSPAQFSASIGLILDSISKIEKRATGAIKGDLGRLGASLTKDINEVTAKQEAIKGDGDFTIGANGKPKHGLGEVMSGMLGVDKGRKTKEDLLATGPFEDPVYDTLDPSKITYESSSKKGAFGDFMNSNSNTIGLGVDLGVNVLDNIVNASLLKKTPELPKPVNYISEPLDTEIDVTDQLSEITDSQAKMDKYIDESTGSSNTAIQRKRASADAALKSKNTVLGQKERIETDLENKDALNRQRIENMNKDLLNTYNMGEYQRETEILGAKSQNISNLSRDLSDVTDKYRLGEFQDAQLMNDALKYGDIGVFATNALKGNYDQVSKADKQKLLNMLQSAGRTSDYNSLKTKWNIS